jgi:hypothetical protein
MSKLTATVRFARATDLSSGCTSVAQAEALSNAQAQNVTIFDTLRTQILLRVASGNSELVVEWLRAIEFGDFSDNYEVYTVSQYQIANGEVEQGMRTLRRLREHIVQRPEELKSVRHILPRIDEAIIQASW